MLVPEHLLNRANINASVEQVCCLLSVRFSA